jgi:hypothetical protein
MGIYVKTAWLDRAIQYVLTYTSAAGTVPGTITLTPAPGVITQAGTAVNAANLNNMENGIAAAVTRTGDGMTGPLILAGDPVSNLQAATKAYDDANNASARLRSVGAQVYLFRNY